MLPNLDNLSPDLEWMLQSGQVDQRTLIEALVQRFYSTIYHQALSGVNNPEEAHQVAQQVFVRAVLEPSTFRGNMQLKDWLVGILAEISPHQDSANQTGSSASGYPDQITKIRQAYETITPEQVELAVQAISSQVSKRKNEQSRKVALQIVGIITALVLVAFILVRNSSDLIFNPLAEATPTSEPTIHISPTPEPRATEQAEEKVDLPAAPDPLSMDSRSVEIRERLENSSLYWDTMWAEVIVTFFGPPSYAGPPHAERHQMWFDHQRGGLLVSGPINEFPDHIERILVPPEFDQSSWSRTDHLILVGSQLPWFTINLETLSSFPFAINFSRNLPITGGPETITFSPVRTGSWAGQQVLIVDLLSMQGTAIGQVYLDPATGIALREQYYSPGSGREVIIESSLKQLAFNQPMPKMWKGPDFSLLSPRIYLPEDNPITEMPDSWLNSPGVRRETRGIAPPNFDPSQSSLVFSPSHPLRSDEVGFDLVDIVADGYLIGEVALPDPLQMICTRSNDGLRIGFAEWSPFPGQETNQVSWFDLENLQLSTHELPEMTLQWIGFSPDNSQLGISGFNSQDNDWTFLLLDLNSGTTSELPIPARYQSIAWSPDGSRLLVLEGVMEVTADGPQRTMSIYSAVDGQLQGKIKVDHPLQETSVLKIPFEGAEISFNQLFQDIDSCAAPPE